MKIFKSKNGQDRTILRAPDGNKFMGIVPALQFMVKAEYPREEIEILAKNLLKVKWQTHEKLPKGWYLKLWKRQNISNGHLQIWYLTEDFDLIKSTKSATEVMLMNPTNNYSQEDIENSNKISKSKDFSSSQSSDASS